MLLTYLCVWVVVLLKHTFQGHFLFGIRQHNLFKYFDVLKLIHDSWHTINRPNTIVWKTSPHTMIFAPPCFTVFTVHCGLNSGPSRLTYWIFTLISPQNVTPFLFGPIDVFHGKFEQILHMPFFQQWCFWGASADSLASIKRHLTVTTVTGNCR